MLENVAVNSIVVDKHSVAFMNSEMQNIEREAILSHFVRLSQEKGRWVTEVTFHDFISSFVGYEFFEDVEDFCSYILALEEEGYLTIERKGPKCDILRVTDKFAELCEKYAQ